MYGYKITDGSETCTVMAVDATQAIKLAHDAGYFVDHEGVLDWSDIDDTDDVSIAFEGIGSPITHTLTEWLAIYDDWRVLGGSLQ